MAHPRLKQRQLGTKGHAIQHTAPASKFKTELLTSSCFLPSSNCHLPISVNGTSTLQAAQTRSLAISLDNFLPTHIQSICKSCLLYFQNISKLDHCPSLNHHILSPGYFSGFLIISLCPCPLPLFSTQQPE